MYPATGLLTITSLFSHFCLFGSSLPFPILWWRCPRLFYKPSTFQTEAVICLSKAPLPYSPRLMAPPSSQLPGVITLASFFFLLLTCNQLTYLLDLTSAKLLHSFSLLHYSFTSQIFLSYHLDYCRGLNNEDYFITPHLAHRYQMSIPGAQLQMCSFSGLKSSVDLLPQSAKRAWYDLSQSWRVQRRECIKPSTQWLSECRLSNE